MKCEKCGEKSRVIKTASYASIVFRVRYCPNGKVSFTTTEQRITKKDDISTRRIFRDALQNCSLQTKSVVPTGQHAKKL